MFVYFFYNFRNGRFSQVADHNLCQKSDSETNQTQHFRIHKKTVPNGLGQTANIPVADGGGHFRVFDHRSSEKIGLFLTSKLYAKAPLVQSQP
jgi:hypothetical protein